MKYSNAINSYLQKHSYSGIQLKTVLFDMDGVLFDSMPYHAEAWYQTMLNQGTEFDKKEAYMHEGRTGAGTINIVFQRVLGRNATPEEVKRIYQEKADLFNSYPEAKAMTGASILLAKIKAQGLTPMIVTGSGQHSLLDRLAHNFPNTFKKELMVTAYDVQFGKPHPEPYLMALQKGNYKPYEAIVVENAPLGVEAGVAAGIFTVAVNTGPLDDQVLLDAGANILFHSMEEFEQEWNLFYKEINNKKGD